MNTKNSTSPGRKIKNFFLLILQRLWICFELYQKNGLANHAAAGAYGFLLSAAPALIIISFFVSNALVNSPELAADMLRQIHFISGVLNAEDAVRNFLSSANSGLGGFFSLITIFWTTRLCALSIRRGLGVVFPGPRLSPLRSTAITLGLGFLIILFIFVMLLGSKFALDLYNFAKYKFTLSFYYPFLYLPVIFFSLLCLTLITLISYRIVPANPPGWKFIIPGALVCMIFYQLFSAGLSLLINPDKYNLLYGNLGRLFIFLVNVFFFFTFFLFGAQFIKVQNSSDALVFISFKRLLAKGNTPRLPKILSWARPWEKLFASLPASLEKYRKAYRKGELVFTKGSKEQEVYYILTGTAGVYLDKECLNRIALIDETHFFGEMEFNESEGRSASIIAETDLSVMALPRPLFRSIVENDPDTDRNLVMDLSERLRSNNKRVIS